MKAKAKNQIFVCQVIENTVRVLTCAPERTGPFDFTALEVIALPADEGADEKKIAQTLAETLKKLGFQRQEIILSFPRANTTCRYLKFPTNIPEEIDKMLSLQASQYLPYPTQELITAYQVIDQDKNGFTLINAVIAHAESVKRSLRIFNNLKYSKLSLILSSYGINNLFCALFPRETDPVMLLDIDGQQVELIVTGNGKIIFNRYFKLSGDSSFWKNLLREEILKTQDAFIKEIGRPAPQKMVCLGTKQSLARINEMLDEQSIASCEMRLFPDKLRLSDAVNEVLSQTPFSYAGLFGLGKSEPEESLKLIPQDIKSVHKRLTRRSEYIRVSLMTLGIIFMVGAGINKFLATKADYLTRLKNELSKLEAQAKPLEEIDTRLKILASRAEKRLSSLQVFYELNKALPGAISLTSFTYEENSQIILHGQAQTLSIIFEFVSQIEKQPVFKNFTVKVKYATQNKSQTGDIVDFEITCNNTPGKQ
ncbi:MAG: pilus assembly protein PilM [Candidatus Omnitrophota bacterium]